jgi:predicted aminopeptidase
MPVDQMRTEKAAELARLRDSLMSLGIPPAGELNNARLAAVATYHRCVPALTDLLAQHGGDLPAFYAVIRALSRDPTARSAYCANR